MTPSSNVVALPTSMDELVLLKPGDYAACYVGHVGVRLFRTLKIRVDFKPLDHCGLVLSRWYRVQGYTGGRVSAGRHSDIVREVSAVLGRRMRHDRIPLSELKDKIVMVRVRTVTTNAKQDALHVVNHYSVIEKVLEGTQ
jgi:hypothetical protein